jgi:hypothetical protein
MRPGITNPSTYSKCTKTRPLSGTKMKVREFEYPRASAPVLKLHPTLQKGDRNPTTGHYEKYKTDGNRTSMT